MKFHADSFLKIGASHKMCEDYILSENGEKKSIVILSDGCSSSPDTDVGARILTFAARDYLLRHNTEEPPDYHKMGEQIISRAWGSAKLMGAPLSCLDATLMVMVPFQDHVCIYVYGDGCIYLRKPDGTLEYIRISAAFEAPKYLSYLMDAAREKQHKELVKGNAAFVTGDGTYSDDVYVIEYDSDLRLMLSAYDYDVVAISSDGADTFINPETKKLVPLEEITKEFLTFKGTKGEFLKRRVARAVKTWSKSGIEHYDDLSVGAILIDKEFGRDE